VSFLLDFSDQARLDVEFHKKSGNKILVRKLLALFNELIDHPFKGTGKPEALKHHLTDIWSRRINLEHRLVYRVDGETVTVLSVRGHY